MSELAFSGQATDSEQEDWFRENGPDVPGLIAHLASQGNTYDAVLFWAFPLRGVYFGLPRVADRTILVPTAEEDPVIRMAILERFLALPAGYVFLTPEGAGSGGAADHQSAAVSRHRGRTRPRRVSGVADRPAVAHDVREPFTSCNTGTDRSEQGLRRPAAALSPLQG